MLSKITPVLNLYPPILGLLSPHRASVRLLSKLHQMDLAPLPCCILLGQCS
jgi:hypothetical protein